MKKIIKKISKSHLQDTIISFIAFFLIFIAYLVSR